jgi:uncharacterized protein
MQCPNDQTTLLMTERQGIEIDYCPTCRGVWLDKGELDKLIASSENSSPAYQAPSTQPRYEEPQRYQESRPHYSDDHSHYKKKHKKESFLGELFDF